MSLSLIALSKRLLSGACLWVCMLGVLGCSLPVLPFVQMAVAATPLQGSVIKTDETDPLPTVNQDDVRKVEAGTLLEMTVSTTLGTGMSESGDEFFAKVSRDYKVGNQVVIPHDTIVHGQVSNMKDAGYAGRDANITLKFDYMITPDGREIPIEGGYTNKDGAVKSAAKVVARGAGFTAVGGLIGSLVVLKYGGLASVAATNGYALAGGAAVGGALGLTAAMASKGKGTLIQPGMELKVRLKENLALPTVNMPDESASDVKLEGLSVQMLGMQIGKDPFGEANEITLSLNMQNQTENTFTFFDICLEDEYGTVFYASPFGDTGMWFRKLTPNSKMAGNITFNVDNPKRKHYLVFYKHYTREPLAKLSITVAPEMDAQSMKKLGKKTSMKQSNEVAAKG